MQSVHPKTAVGRCPSGDVRSKLCAVFAFLLITLLVPRGIASAAPTTKKTNSADKVARKLVTSYHLTYVDKQDEDRYYDEWVRATYNGKGRITHKEIEREVSKEFGGWNGELSYSLDFEYDSDGRLVEVSGTEDDWGAMQDAELPVEWEISYGKDGTTSRADGTERSDPRHVYDTFNEDGSLVSRDYLIRAGQMLDIGEFSLSYDAAGRLTGQASESSSAGLSGGDGQSAKTHYDISVNYDQTNRITSIETRDSDGKLIGSYTYEHDGKGRMTRRSRFRQGGLDVSQTYSYDKKGHLTSMDEGTQHATFTTDKDGSIVSARIESDTSVQTYEIKYVTKKTPKGQEPVNAVDLTDPMRPELYDELWVSHASLDSTPFGETDFLRENRRWLELHEGTSGASSANVSDAETEISRYESVLKAYREGLKSNTQPSEETVNPMAWSARDDEEFAYALHDLNGDGSAELLVGVEESEPLLQGGQDVYYRLFDLFTLVDGKPTRVLGDEAMTSLGYRAYCVACEGGVLETGGSGGATYHMCEFWQMGDKANELALSHSVIMDGDSYTFTDDSGNSETLTGNKAADRYAETMAAYTPITRFDWCLLNTEN